YYLTRNTQALAARCDEFVSAPARWQDVADRRRMTTNPGGKRRVTRGGVGSCGRRPRPLFSGLKLILSPDAVSVPSPNTSPGRRGEPNSPLPRRGSVPAGRQPPPDAHAHGRLGRLQAGRQAQLLLPRLQLRPRPVGGVLRGLRQRPEVAAFRGVRADLQAPL